jgi:sigma-B regulation protein RsbU (phosphoserine phosphatase)
VENACGAPSAAAGAVCAYWEWMDMRHPLLISLATGLLAFAAANAAESALITARGGAPWLAAWTSEVVLSCAVVGATYLWLHVRSLQGALSSFERARIELDKELRLAAAIQRHLLKAPGAFPSLSWHALLQPARRVGGDLYDVLTLPQGSVWILTADISGKGIPAAIALASALATFRQIARRTPDLQALAGALSHAIHDDNGGSPYMTAILCLVDPAKGELRYVNAGHPAGRLAGPGGLVRLEPTGPPLGLMPDGQWEAPSLDARAFTLGLLVTDGVVEALEAEGDPDEILDSLAAGLAGGTPEAACAAVMRRALRAGPSPLAPPDDRTVLAFIPGGHRV